MKIQEKNSCVYGIYDNTGKIIYVGCSINYISRYSYHCESLRNGTHENNILQMYCDSIGFENLVFVPLFFCEQNDLFYNELMFIKLLNPLANKSGVNKINLSHSSKSYILKNKDILNWIDSNVKKNIIYLKSELHNQLVLLESTLTPKRTKMYLDYYCKTNGLTIKHSNSPNGRTCKIQEKIF